MMDKREKILESALRLFVERGFHATPTSVISSHAGVSAGILFHYFSTKEDLITRLFVATKLEFYQAILNQVDEVSTFQGKMRLAWTNLWQWGMTESLKFRFVQQIHHSPYIHIVDENEDIQAIHAQLVEVFEQGIQEQYIKNIPVDLLILTSFNLVISFVEYLSVNPELIKNQALIEQAWEVYWDSIKNKLVV